MVIRDISRAVRTTDIIVAAALFLTLTPLGIALYESLWALVPVEPLGSRDIISLVISALLLCTGMAVLRLTPGLALALVCAGIGVHISTWLLPVPVNLTILPAVFATAAWGSTLVLRFGLVSVIVGGIGAGFYLVASGHRAEGTPWEVTVGNLWLYLSVFMLLILGFAWVCGLLWRTMLRARRIRKDQRAELHAVEEAERVRIARDMHDIVAHSLAVIVAQADGARYAAATRPEVASEALATISRASREALSDVRLLLTQLRHQQGDGPQPTLADLEALFAQMHKSGVEVQVIVEPTPAEEPPGAIQLAVYRIVQEALTNAVRHGSGDLNVQVAWHPAQVEITVRNAVHGDVPTAAGGHGIVGMRERAQLVGGTLETTRKEGYFVVHARLPIQESAS